MHEQEFKQLPVHCISCKTKRQQINIMMSSNSAFGYCQQRKHTLACRIAKATKLQGIFLTILILTNKQTVRPETRYTDRKMHARARMHARPHSRTHAHTHTHTHTHICAKNSLYQQDFALDYYHVA